MVREDQAVVREKAIRLAVRTGFAPDLELVWDLQKLERGRICFGAYQATCPLSCRWSERCRLLTREPVDSTWPGLYHQSAVKQPSSALPPTSDRWLPLSVRQEGRTSSRLPPV